MPFQVASDYSSFHRELASDRLLRIGDAAGFSDPIFSSGVYMSLDSAKAAVELIAAADAAGRTLSASEQRRYTRHVKRRAGTFQKLIAAFYDNASFSVFMVPQIPFDLRAGITAIVAGHAQLIWPLWWRFHAFLLACAIQRRLRLPLGIKLNLTPSGGPA
jgi:flavin-dependent dehydrogenase